MKELIFTSLLLMSSSLFSKEITETQGNVGPTTPYDYCQRMAVKSCQVKVDKFNNSSFNYSQNKLSEKSFRLALLEMERCLEYQDIFCRERNITERE